MTTPGTCRGMHSGNGSARCCGARIDAPAGPAVMHVEPAAAWEAALQRREPVFIPAQVHVDDRGWSLMNLLRGVLSPAGQVNFAVQNPGAVKAWHRHERQTDFWIAVAGHIKAGVHREEDGRSWLMVMGEMRPGVLVIPPLLWHGAAAVGPSPAALLYYVSCAYDPARPDEQRRAHDSVPGFPWGARHG
jgi:dTDP-4-dehydrorhamnose 3,5-epimerase-like enzyme